MLIAASNLLVINHHCRDGDKMVPSVEKKIAELEMGLLHLQQNIDIPEISLAIHPVVTAMVKKCAEDGRRPKVQDFGDKVEDSTFLNQLQNGVNRWIREIQKVKIVFKIVANQLYLIADESPLQLFLNLYMTKAVRTNLLNYWLFTLSCIAFCFVLFCSLPRSNFRQNHLGKV